MRLFLTKLTINILERWYIIKHQVRQGKSAKDSHKALLDLLGIRNDNWTHASKNQSFYTHNVDIEIKPSKKEFFVPPIFGSASQKKFQLVICGATISDDQLEQFLVDGSGKFGPKILFWVGKLSVNKIMGVKKLTK